MTDWLQDNFSITGEFTLLNTTSLGLRPDPHSKYSLQLNYILLLARYHVWQARLEETSPNFTSFLRLVKSRYVLETKAGDTKKMDSFCRIFIKSSSPVPLTKGLLSFF